MPIFRTLTCALAVLLGVGSGLHAQPMKKGLDLEGKPLRGLETTYYGIAVSAQGVIAGGGPNYKIELWDAATRKEIRVLEGHQGPVWSVAYSPNGDWLASASSDKSIRLWTTADGKAKGQPLTGHEDIVTCVTASSDGKWLASGSWDGTVRLWNAESGKEEAKLVADQGAIFSVAFSADGSLLASGGRKGTVKVWNVADKKEEAIIKNGNRTVWAIVWTGPTQLATGDGSGEIRSWDIPRGSTTKELSEAKQVLSGHKAAIRSLTFANGVLISGSEDRSIRVWPPGETATVLTADAEVVGLCATPDGQTIVSAAKSVLVWKWKK